MTSQDNRQKEIEQRERKLREREVELRLREMETEINAPIHQTIKHQPDNSQKPWMKKLVLGGKLFLLGVATLVAVRIASAVAGIIMISALVWISYKLFSDSKNNRS
ncbi:MULTISPECIES: hypothetical protein [unclassified Nodularia (in: cyanobacteria)]|uniref:hypothetical protein n=1 Tax=unclassified Nodularia (in: cyanobacteria) TaxID=2656917 RepID=UPI001881FCA7|nr:MULTISPECIES: hypothetical protein [unclassified Nodularia (in: cyanobacteria)]MBE9201460.1 hypothetical protein [Nodularia sp. LEGE 06071]MCC2691456.1 hypothetical protein [Nodularia sp. LEGE 04288]